jgi:heme-degrading monooxygenase HmoA
MIAVIFKATLSQQLLSEADLNSSNQEELKRYLKMAEALRKKALSDYGCISFISSTDRDQEIAVSYWPDIQAVSHWKNDALHIQAQQLGRNKWYKDYSVDIVEVLRSYGSVNSAIKQ